MIICKKILYCAMISAIISPTLLGRPKLNNDLTQLLKKNDSHSVLSPRDGEPVKVNLLRNGQPAFEILLPAAPSTIDQKAASILKNALDVGTGSSFTIIKEPKAPHGAVFSIGKTKLYSHSGLKPSIELGAAGYMIQRKNGNFFLIGDNKRGAISPVIALVEEDFGERLYAVVDGLQMPRLASEQIIMLREYRPVFTVRTMFQSESFNAEFQLFNRVGASDSRFEYVPASWGGYTALPKKYFVHTCWQLLPNDKYFATHPEYFSLVNGKRIHQGHGGGGHLCWTNPDVRRIVTAKVLKELTTYHSYRLFDISPNDSSGGFCQCKNCQAIAQREGSEAGPLLDFVNCVAQKVKKKYPHVKITTMAYAESKQPPKQLRPADNVIIRLANEYSAHYPMFNIDDHNKFLPLLKGWNDIGADIFIWDYVVNYGGWPMPWPNLEVIDHNIDVYAKNGVKALFLQSSHYGPGENQGRLRAWVYAQKMWDPRRKIADLVREFNYGYFGKVASLMQEYSDLLLNEWKLYRKNHKVTDSTRRILKLSNNYYPKASQIFKQALKLAAGDKKLLDKVEYEYISILFYRLEFLSPKNKADKKQYIKDLELFSKLADKFKVRRITENSTTTPTRIIEWKRKNNIVSEGDLPVIITLGAKDATRVGNGSKRYDDISVPGGKVIKLPMDGKEWAVQWFFGSCLFNNTTYKARIQVRIDKKHNSGLAIVGGIYSVSLKKNALNIKIDADKLPESGFKWIDCGTFNGSDAASAYFFLAQYANSAASNVYITGIEFIPQGVKLGTKAVRKVTVKKAVYTTNGKAKTFTATAFKVEKAAKLISNAGNRVVAIASTDKGWNTQLKLPGKVTPGKYHILLNAKVIGPKSGYGIRVAIYSPQAKKCILETMVSTMTLPQSDQYQWIDCGDVTTTSDPRAYLFIAGYGDSSFKQLLIKSVEFIPIK